MANNFYGPQQRSFGQEDAPHVWDQLSTLSKPQQAAQYAMLARGIGGMLNPFNQQPDFEPIKNEYMRSYREQNLPAFMNNQTGNTNSSSYGREVALGDIDLASRLSALHQNFKQQQFDKNRDYEQNLIQQGMKPSFENMYSSVPWGEAEKYLKRQGITNPTREQIDKATAQFEPPRPLGWNDVQGAAKTGAAGLQNIQKAYQQGGIRGAAGEIGNIGKNALFGPQNMQQGPPANNGLTDSGQKYLTDNPDVKASVDKSSRGASPEQQEVINNVVSKLSEINAPILKENLSPENYQELDAIQNSPNEKVQKLLPLIRTKKELDKLRHYVKHGNSFRMKMFLWELSNRKKKEDKRALRNTIEGA